MAESIEFFSAVLIVSKDPARLAAFYRDTLGVPLKEEKHGDTAPHYGCELGDLHFAIHPRENFEDAGEPSGGAVRLAFTVFDIESIATSLREKGVALLYPPRDVGFCKMTALRDPDGNTVELTELGNGWFNHLEDRRRRGLDVLARHREQHPR
ncbi:MAG: VOC family protein [Deltaproteobacteria bacterium]|nr:VOC family protein [Deltaproteobacteria bacterium]